jgi:hypothetical protein
MTVTLKDEDIEILRDLKNIIKFISSYPYHGNYIYYSDLIDIFEQVNGKPVKGQPYEYIFTDENGYCSKWVLIKQLHKENTRLGQIYREIIMDTRRVAEELEKFLQEFEKSLGIR